MTYSISLLDFLIVMACIFPVTRVASDKMCQPNTKVVAVTMYMRRGSEKATILLNHSRQVRAFLLVTRQKAA